MIKLPKKLVDDLFSVGVEPASSNIYRKLLMVMEQVNHTNKVGIGLTDLLEVLKKYSKKWDQEIDKIIK